MAQRPNDAGVDEKFLSVRELEEEIRANPGDVDLKEELAEALVKRYLYGEDGKNLRNRADIKRAREIIHDLPDSKAYYPRAYLAYLESKLKDAVRWLENYARGIDPTNVGEAFNPNELYYYIVCPSAGASKEFWSDLAESIGKLWPESPAALTLAAYARQYEKNLDQAFDFYERALRADKDYWLASWGLGEINLIQKNWQAALQCYERSMQSEMARVIAQIVLDAGFCAGKLGQHTMEEKHYRACLELDPDWPNARNNLGWSLYRQGRFEEALAVFDDCIARKVDGAYPRRNRARTLARLGRLTEAIQAWKQTGRSGEVSKYAQEHIDKLQQRISRGEKNIGRELGEPDEEEFEEGAGYQERKR